MSTILIHLLICYYFTYELDLGVTGIGLATMITCFLNMLFVMLYSWKRSEYKVKPIPRQYMNLLDPSEVMIYLEISIPSIIMLCADWWAYESIVIIAAFIGTAAVGAMAISYNYLFLIYSFPCGF